MISTRTSITPDTTLSTIELLRVIASSTQDYKKFVDEVMECQFIAGDEFADWKGIDSKFCVVMIYLAINHSQKDTFQLTSFHKKLISRVYTTVYLVYQKACQESGLSFIPCLKGLSTILKNAIIARKKLTANNQRPINSFG